MAEIMNTVSMAVTAMQLEKPEMCMTPEPANSPGGRTGLVGREAWIYFCPNGASTRPAQIGPVNRVATAGVVTVTANAVNSGVLVNWGDRSAPTFCAGALLPFTPYTDAVDASPMTPPSGMPSPTCGHRIERSSETEPGGVHNLSVTSNFVVTWTAVFPGGGTGGVMPIPLTSTYQQRIGELQVLVTPN